MSVTFLLLASYGVCFGLMNEKVPLLNQILHQIPISEGPEGNFFERMLACAYCTGFHTGWVVWLLGGGVGEPLLQGVLFAFASSASCYTLDTALRWLEK